jgi:hypothetical protein
MQMPARFTVLQAIFFLSSAALPITRAGLGERLGLGALELERQLVALDRAGFIDVSRLRLTLPGLAVAVAMRASKRASSARRAQVTRIAA